MAVGSWRCVEVQWRRIRQPGSLYERNYSQRVEVSLGGLGQHWETLGPSQVEKFFKVCGLGLPTPVRKSPNRILGFLLLHLVLQHKPFLDEILHPLPLPTRLRTLKVADRLLRCLRRHLLLYCLDAIL